ncbi:glycosyltransferase [Patescibacteria group bacterium]|nr:glycosyltransferase [Patescibacteria group bacterium]
MKILLVNYKHEYDRSWNNLGRRSTSYYLEYLPLKAVAEEHGHTVDIFYIDEAILVRGLEGARKMFWEYITTEKPDVCLAGFNEYDLGKEIYRKVKDETSTELVYIGDDDTWRWERVSRHFAHCFNWILTYDGRAIKKYKSIGCKNIIHHQPGVDLETYRKLENVKKDIDVSFVGLWSKPREQLIHYLRSKGVDVFVRGVGWPEGPISQEELIRIINRSKIVLSLNTPAFYFGWRPIVRLFFRRAYFGEKGLPIKLDIQNLFDNMRSWLMKRNAQVKSRHFEVPACGTLEMTQDADDMKDYYKLGEEIVVYKNEKDLVEKIKYYLAHSDEREAIAKAGYERTQREHSTKQRFEDIFKMIGKPL